MKRVVCLSLLALLAACGTDPRRDYDSSAACKARGLAPDTPEFEHCVDEEAQARMMEQQRRDFEQRREDDRDWRLIHHM